ncbi:hypothetical protein J5TS2_42150 [Brevibacillus halotolerans]|uniref:hypothetical protein n=1 Tax=Brevibacillus halotolerans TaxID=1507437 RepID=UPI001B18C82D|nr:hypothetical protein [Brevibacillus halotolerans]GIO03547.1 hypothetical protein J5TS2_42150 [Brevibacillus halotolerans]
MAKLPDQVRAEIVEKVYSLADEECWLTNSRVENARFMDRLVADPLVGGVLQTFMSEEKIRTYIKDGILNQYAKKKRAISDDDLLIKISDYYTDDCQLIEKKTDVYYMQLSEQNQVLVCVKGTYVKWETALKKILLNVSALRKINNSAAHGIKKMIVILTAGIPIPVGNDECLRKALNEIDVDVLII